METSPARALGWVLVGLLGLIVLVEMVVLAVMARWSRCRWPPSRSPWCWWWRR